MYFIRTWKTIFILFLFWMFIFLFGKPSLEKYLKKDTIFVESKVKFDVKNPPALTVMNSNPRLYLNLQQCRSLSNGSYGFTIDCYNNQLVNKTKLLSRIEPSAENINLSWFHTIAPGEL